MSDVDMAVLLKKGSDFSESKLEILGNLMEILQTDEIDLVVLNTTTLPLLIKILENKKLIVDKVPFQRHQFESLTMRKYFDFSVKESTILRRRYLNGCNEHQKRKNL